MLPLSANSKSFQKKDFYGVLFNGLNIVSSNKRVPFREFVRKLFDHLIKNNNMDLIDIIIGSDLLYDNNYIFVYSEEEYKKRQTDFKSNNGRTRRLDTIYMNEDKSLYILSSHELSNIAEADLVKKILGMFLHSLDEVSFRYLDK